MSRYSCENSRPRVTASIAWSVCHAVGKEWHPPFFGARHLCVPLFAFFPLLTLRTGKCETGGKASEAYRA
jgi:hypothetical protein